MTLKLFSALIAVTFALAACWKKEEKPKESKPAETAAVATPEKKAEPAAPAVEAPKTEAAAPPVASGKPDAGHSEAPAPAPAAAAAAQK